MSKLCTLILQSRITNRYLLCDNRVEWMATWCQFSRWIYFNVNTWYPLDYNVYSIPNRRKVLWHRSKHIIRSLNGMRLQNHLKIWQSFFFVN
jgi:hypothetical protein